jgi:hypothetical protein
VKKSVAVTFSRLALQCGLKGLSRMRHFRTTWQKHGLDLQENLVITTCIEKTLWMQGGKKTSDIIYKDDTNIDHH